MSHDAAVHMTDSCARTSPAIPNPDFGFDAEVAADVAGEPLAGVNGSSPPIAVPASKANQARPNLSVQVAYDPPEFRTVSPPTWGLAAESSDSPIGGGLMYVKSDSCVGFLFDVMFWITSHCFEADINSHIFHGAKNPAKAAANPGQMRKNIKMHSALNHLLSDCV